jgi:hypothetical protein
MHTRATLIWRKPCRVPARLFLVAGGFLFLGQLIVPNIVAQTKLGRQRFGFADIDLAAFGQEFLNKRIVGGFFGDLFYNFTLSEQRQRGNDCFQRNPAQKKPRHHNGRRGKS